MKITVKVRWNTVMNRKDSVMFRKKQAMSNQAIHGSANNKDKKN